MEEPSVLDAWTGAFESFDVDSLGGQLITGVTPEAQSVQVLMALREIALILQTTDGNIGFDHRIEVPTWAATALFRTVMKRLR